MKREAILASILLFKFFVVGFTTKWKELVLDSAPWAGSLTLTSSKTRDVLSTLSFPVTYNGRMRCFVIVDGKGITTWNKDAVSQQGASQCARQMRRNVDKIWNLKLDNLMSVRLLRNHAVPDKNHVQFFEDVFFQSFLTNQTAPPPHSEGLFPLYQQFMKIVAAENVSCVYRM